MKTKLFITGLLMVVIISSCSTPGYLPASENIDVNQNGSFITILQNSGKHVKGELIAIDSTRLIVLAKSGINDTLIPVIIPVFTVNSFTLKYARPKHYGWSIPVYTLATIGHGVFLIITAPVNLIVTISVTVGGETSFEYNDKNMTYDKLKMFARFPQGIPPGVDIASLK